MRVGVQELKARLSHYLDLVKAGECVTVTDHGRPVAELRAPTPLPDDLPPKLRRLIEEGHARLGGPMRDLPPPIPLLPGDSGKTMVEYVSEQRGDSLP